jgi:hypothetical protein
MFNPQRCDAIGEILKMAAYAELLFTLFVIVMLRHVVPTFSFTPVQFTAKNVHRRHQRTPSSFTTCMDKRTWCRMVRNIDLVEALIFYGAESILLQLDGYDDSSATATSAPLFLPGVESLIDECQRDDTAVLAIVENENQVYAISDVKGNIVHTRQQSALPPNPRDLYESILAVEIQPKGFGGSSGFGTKAPDPVRTPLPKHCVVLCSTEDQCRAARFMGMRVLCMTDNDLADAVIDDGNWCSIGMDDIATPGSFWLNPPHSRDDEGNAVDPVLVMERYINGSDSWSSNTEYGIPPQEKTMDDDYLSAVLADMDPL